MEGDESGNSNGIAHWGRFFGVIRNERRRFIDEHSSMFWYTPDDKKHDISDDLLVETVLNDGTLDDFRELKRILTPQRIAKVFFSAQGR